MSAQVIEFPRRLTGLSEANADMVLRRVRMVCMQHGLHGSSRRRVELIASGDLSLGRAPREVIARAEKLARDCSGNNPKGVA